MADWPLILAGPILRKVTPDEVSVWVALSEARTVHLSIYGGLVNTGAGTDVYTGSPLKTGTIETMQFGPKCHVAVVTAFSADDLGGVPLLPIQFYSYNVGFSNGDGVVEEDLKSLRLLVDVLPSENSPDDPKPHLALGYEQNALPSFALPPWEPNLQDPSALKHLQILHGSCRKGHGEGPDAMKWIDKFIKDNRTDLLTRPHQLFLTGDQIYSDEIIPPLLDIIFDVAKELVGFYDNVPTSLGNKICDPLNFPPGFREEMMLQEAGFTTGLGDSHLITFGEFMAMYVMNWSNVVWPAPPLRDFQTIAKEMSSAVDTLPLLLPRMTGQPMDVEDILVWLLSDTEETGDPKRTRLCRVALGEPNDQEKGTIETLSKVKKKIVKFTQDALVDLFRHDEERRQAVKDMYDALPFVRRALANVPTYMIMDDHEVTDDWNVTQEWTERVYNKEMGRYIIRNALASFVVCQAWGNDPTYFLLESGATALSLIQNAYATTFDSNLSLDFTELDQLFGLSPLSNLQSPLRFHFQVKGPHHLVIALDSRTMRGFDSALSPPALLNQDALWQQIPSNLLDGALDSQIEVVLVVAPAPVFGPPLIEETVWPALMRVWDLTEVLEVQRSRGFQRWDAEAWGFNPVGFERFLARLARLHRPIVFLSGDVHYSAAAQLDYFTNVSFAEPTNPDDPFAPEPPIPPYTRFVQFTSSAVKNGWPMFAQAILRFISLPQLCLDWASKVERLCWNENSPDTVVISPNNTEPVPTDLLLRRLKQPVMVPTKRWPKNTTLHRDPDWSWVMTPLFDNRDDTLRPADTKPPDLDGEAILGNHDQKVAAYAAVANRHIQTLATNTNTRKLIFSSNIGWIKFADKPDGKYVEQCLYSVHPDNPNGQPEPYTCQEAALFVAADAEPPIIEEWQEPTFQ